MRYEGNVYRPPSEASSLIIQTTIGCSHNRCTFCNMYKGERFRARKIDEVVADLRMARSYYEKVRRVFLADGNALVLDTDYLKTILVKINNLFPECERVSIYGGPKDILDKSPQDLEVLRSYGLALVYLGIESGSSTVLQHIDKGVTPDDMVTAGKKVVESGIALSATLISGLGGKKLWEEHALESAKVINEIQPHYLALLTLLVEPGTQMYQEVKNGRFEPLKPAEVMLEAKELISKLELTKACIFRSNHVSNYVALAGTLPGDKQALLKQVNFALQKDVDYRPDCLRCL